MLRFPCPLTAAATEIFVSCLEISADMVVDFDPPEAWREAYPLSATCFTPELARETLLDLVAKLRLPEAYVPTEYHWLLMYECLQALIEVLNDDPLPSLVAQLTTLATAQDALYLSSPPEVRGALASILTLMPWLTRTSGIPISSWTLKFSQLGADAKTRLGFVPRLRGDPGTHPTPRRAGLAEV